MTTRVTSVCAALALSYAATAIAQSPKAATYITDEQVKAVNATPGVDRQIVSVDIGKLNEAVGIIHRGPTTAGAGRGPGAAAGAGGAAAGRGTGAGAGASAAAGRAQAAAPVPCGEQSTTPPPAGTASGISHDHQTETYIIVSGGGTLVTGGRIVNGRKSAPESEVTRVLNGPSCSGLIMGDDVVKKVVKTGDIIIIPAGVPHGWTDITDHVDYLSVRPDPDRVLPAGYVHPALKK
jgi:mannose-6-phosphate isomerase-like protein (cupin superfamily)